MADTGTPDAATSERRVGGGGVFGAAVRIIARVAAMTTVVIWATGIFLDVALVAGGIG